MIKDNWLKLDINKDGFVSLDDMMKSVNSLYEFLINYEYQQKISEVTTDLYQKALKMVKGGEHPPEQIQESEK